MGLARLGDYVLLGELTPGLLLGRRTQEPRPGPVLIERPEAPGAQPVEVVRRRAKALGALEHPLLAKLLEVGVVEGRCHAVYAHRAGTPLQRAFAIAKEHQRWPDPVWVIRAFAGVLEALDRLHQAFTGLPEELGLHGHLGPNALLVDDQDELLIADLAVVRGAGLEGGVPGYAAPEQVLQGLVDRRADLFAIGALMFECLTGRPYLDGPNPRARRAAAADPPTLEGVNLGKLGPLLASALDPSPERRFASAADFAAALRRLVPPAELGSVTTRPFAFGFPPEDREGETMAGPPTELRDFWVEGDVVPLWSFAELHPPASRPPAPLPTTRSSRPPASGPSELAVHTVTVPIAPRPSRHGTLRLPIAVAACLLVGLSLGLILSRRNAPPAPLPRAPTPPLAALDAALPPKEPATPPSPRIEARGVTEAEPSPPSAPPPPAASASPEPRRRPRAQVEATRVAPAPPVAPAIKAPPVLSVRGLITRARTAKEALPPGPRRVQLEELLGRLAFKAQAPITTSELQGLERELTAILEGE